MSHPMTQETWDAVDAWFAGMLTGPDEELEQALAEGERAGLRNINVSANQGKLLHLLARASGARHVLEVGTLAGYSAIWLARALPDDGRLITLEISPTAAEVARANLRRAGLEDRVEVRLGPALESMAQIAGEGIPAFDLVFIDADKQNNPGYFEWALKLTRPGSLIIIDNVVRSAYVLDGDDPDANIQGVRRVVEMIANEPRVSATAIQTVGEKGYDGFLIALVTS
jgi:predicted O-methyltransferase YrrM